MVLFIRKVNINYETIKLVKKVIVHVLDKSSGHRKQRIEIAWNSVGELEQDEDKQSVERQRKSRAA